MTHLTLLLLWRHATALWADRRASTLLLHHHLLLLLLRADHLARYVLKIAGRLAALLLRRHSTALRIHGGSRHWLSLLLQRILLLRRLLLLLRWVLLLLLLLLRVLLLLLLRWVLLLLRILLRLHLLRGGASKRLLTHLLLLRVLLHLQRLLHLLLRLTLLLRQCIARHLLAYEALLLAQKELDLLLNGSDLRLDSHLAKVGGHRKASTKASALRRQLGLRSNFQRLELLLLRRLLELLLRRLLHLLLLWWHLLRPLLRWHYVGVIGRLSAAAH